MTIHPCVGCYLAKECSRRHAIMTLLKGGSITSLKIKCEDNERLYAPGVRVYALLHDYEDLTDESQSFYPEGNYLGTIMFRAGTRLAVWLDEDQETARDRIKVAQCRLTFANEPPVEVCSCGTPFGKKKTRNWMCNECDQRSGRK